MSKKQKRQSTGSKSSKWAGDIMQKSREGGDLALYIANKNPIPTALSGYALVASLSGRAAVKNGFARKAFDRTVVHAGGAALWPGIAAAKIAEVHGGDTSAQFAAGGVGTAGSVALMRKYGVKVVSKYAAPIGIATMLGDTAARTTKAIGGSKAAQKASFWGTAALVAGAMVKIGSRANVPMLVGSLALSVGQHFYNRYKQKQQPRNIAGFNPEKMKILLAGKSLAEQKHITEEAAKNPLPRLRKEQSQHGALALAGGALLSAGGAAKIKLPTGKAGLLTGLAVGLYGLMLGGNARAEGLKQQKAVSKLNLEHPARGVNRQTAAQNSFAAQHAQYGLWSAIKSGITAGFNPPATPARRTAPHGDAAMKQIARDGFGKAVMDAISIMPPEKRSSEPPKPRHVWDDNARKAAALARRTNAAYGKASADARNRTPPAKPPPQPTTKTKPTKGRDKQAAAPETGGSGKIKVTRNGTTYYRQRSKREKA